MQSADAMGEQSILEEVSYTFKDADMTSDPITSTLKLDDEYSRQFDSNEGNFDESIQSARFYKWIDKEAFENFIKIERLIQLL